ncbi:MAG TPA: DNA repair protein RecO [Bacteroidales bacterium]|nr:DNA repair protein RecO [Bacteroidales bacterium]HQL70186.1 DNA repair protein RecO [Bacteroidales bacterium]
MIVKTRAIVLHKTPYGDSAFIVQLFTEQLGRQAVIVKGSRSRNSKARAALFQPLSLLVCEFDFRENRNLHQLREVQLETAYTQIYGSITRSSIALFFCEMLMRCIKEEGPQEELFVFLNRLAVHLDISSEKTANLPLHFMLRLLPYLGFKPGENRSPETPFFNIREGVFLPVYTTDSESLDERLSAKLFQLMLTDESTYPNLEMNSTQRAELTRKMLDYFAMHIAGFGKMKSLPVLHEVLTSESLN